MTQVARFVCPRPRRPRGFSLIELMVALSIAAILMSVAYPSYMEQVRKGQRAEAQAVLDWAGVAFGDAAPSGREAAVRVELRRQDHSVLRFGQSCIETPIKIGQQEFKRGLGTHANSEIILHLPPGAISGPCSAGQAASGLAGPACRCPARAGPPGRQNRAAWE